MIFLGNCKKRWQLSLPSTSFPVRIKISLSHDTAEKAASKLSRYKQEEVGFKFQNKAYPFLALG
jgi:hypothetical protein